MRSQEHPRRMRRPGPLWCLLAVSLAAASGCFRPLHSPATSAASTAVAIVGGTVIDGNGGPPLRDATIIVQGQRIAALGPSDSVAVPLGARVIDATGKFVTPGLIATNYLAVPLSYLMMPASQQDPPADSVRSWEDRLEALTIQGLEIALKRGITTIRSSAGYLPVYKPIQASLASGRLVGSRLLVAGNIVGWGGLFSKSWTGIDTSGLALTEWRKQVNALMTQGSGEELLSMTPEALRVAINAYLDRAPDFIKFGATSHANDSLLFSPEQQAVLVDAAHRRGTRIETHATSLEAKRMAVLAGIDLMQHPEIGPLDDSLARLMVERGVLCSMTTLVGDFGETMDNRRRLFEAGCTISLSAEAPLPSPPNGTAQGLCDYFTCVGENMYQSLEGALAMGMTPGQVIVAATKHGAMASGALKDYGTLEVGKYADLLVLDADPLASLRHFRRLSLVMKEGQVIDRSRLPSHPVYDMEGPAK